MTKAKPKTEPEPTEEVTGVKGFGPGWKCLSKQYEVGQTYEEPNASLCNSGMHFVTNPLDVFGYYPPSDSHYAEVVGSGDLQKATDDSKVVCTKLHIKAEVGLSGIVTAGVKFILDRVKWEDAPAANTGHRSAAANTGDRSAATNTGDQSAATNTGDRSAAANTGDRSAAANTGYWSAATVEGKESVAMATGYQSKAKGALGCWLVLAEWDKEPWNNGHIIGLQSVRVDGSTIKADTFYRLSGGQFVEAK